MPAKSYSGWIAFFVLLGIVAMAVGTGVLRFYTASTERTNQAQDFPSRVEAPPPTSMVDLNQCVKVVSHDYKVPDNPHDLLMSGIAWKATIHNQCNRTLQISVWFYLYDRDDYQIDMDVTDITLAPGATQKVSSRAVTVDTKDKVRQIRRSAVEAQVVGW